MSGGAWTLECRIKTEGGVNTAGSRGEIRVIGAASAGAAARQALRHFAASIPSSQQPSGAGIGMLMLSHGMSADCAHALTAGPKASQNAKTAARMGRPFKRFSG